MKRFLPHLLLSLILATILLSVGVTLSEPASPPPVVVGPSERRKAHVLEPSLPDDALTADGNTPDAPLDPDIRNRGIGDV
jgi:hypothetical protein